MFQSCLWIPVPEGFQDDTSKRDSAVEMSSRLSSDVFNNPAKIYSLVVFCSFLEMVPLLDMFSLLLMSIVIGFLGALTGLGGASILIPILVFFGIPVKEAIASGMVAIIATSSGSAASFVRDRITNVKVAMWRCTWKCSQAPARS
jgi:hypothetical protein